MHAKLREGTSLLDHSSNDYHSYTDASKWRNTCWRLKLEPREVSTEFTQVEIELIKRQKGECESEAPF